MIDTLMRMHAETLAALTESKARTASETVEISRSGTSGNATVIKIGAVAQDGEHLDAALVRAGTAFEQAASRYPLPNGLTHPHPLGEGIEAAPSLEEQLQASVDDEVGAKRRGNRKDTK
jgi:hypothetical protein